MPSMTNRGWPSPCSVLMPRMLIEVLAPGSPDDDVIVTPGALAARALTMLRSDDLTMSAASTVVVTVPRTSRVDEVPEPVTTTSPRRSGLAGRTKSWAMVPPESVTVMVAGRYPRARAVSCTACPTARPAGTTKV